MIAKVTIPCAPLQRNAEGKALSIQHDFDRKAEFWTFNDYYTVFEFEGKELVFHNGELRQLLGFISAERMK